MTSVELRIAVNTISRYLAQVTVSAVNFLLTPYLVTHVGAAMFGLQVLSSQVLQLSFLINGALTAGYTRYAMLSYAQRDYDAMNAVLGRGLVATVLLAIPSFALVLISVIFAKTFFGLSNETLWCGRIVILISGLAMLAGIISNVWQSATFFTERFYIIQIGAVISSLLSAMVVVAVFFLTKPSIIVWVAISSSMGLLATWFVGIPWARRVLPEMKISPKFDSFQDIWPMVNFSLASLLGGFGFLLYYATDAIIISNLFGEEFVTTYYIGQRWDPLIQGVIVSFASTLQPAMLALFAENKIDSLRRITYRLSRYCMLIALLPCLLLFAFAAPFIHLWMGEKFVAEASPVLQLCMVGVALFTPGVAQYQVLMAAGHIRRVAIVTAICGASNIVLAVVLAKYCGLGLLGIVLSTMTTYCFNTGIYNVWQVHKRIQTNAWEHVKHSWLVPYRCLVVPACFAVVFRLWFFEPETWPMLLAEMAVVSIAYAASAWTFGLDAEDRQKAREGLRRIAEYTYSRLHIQAS